MNVTMIILVKTDIAELSVTEFLKMHQNKISR